MESQHRWQILSQQSLQEGPFKADRKRQKVPRKLFGEAWHLISNLPGWSLFITLAGESWTMVEHTADLLSCWIRRGGSKSQKRWWKTVPACIWWTIWKERNERIFKGRSNSIQKIKGKCTSTLCFWCKEQCIVDEIQIVDFLGLLFRRHLNNWEINRVAELLNTLEQYKDLTPNEDSLFWLPDKQGRFSAGSAYKTSQRSVSQSSGWPWKMI
ncbi:hypothetical protein H5410_005396 [Solanum commersonii]|uniref:Uncharacterized protein n=1 Tax=Solanum commersonii TaxID=4109 RepID=A0A9J6A761_SOLCO|nr:hypothetical protein H5410_005396 [Solanum commersonii]